MTEQEMWAAYCQAHPRARNQRHDAWRYGSDAPDLLAELTARGVKTATASAYPLYEYEKSPLPQVGQLSVVLNSRDEAVCVIENQSVAVTLFSRVGARHAYLEGEGDRSLAFWRREHAKFFGMDLAEIGQAFSEEMPVVLEEFRVVYGLPGQ